MTPEKIDLVQSSFKKVAPIADTAADIFYDRLFEIAPDTRSLGARHHGYNVTEAHYDSVGAALIYTLGKGLGEDFTPETEAAWTETYGLLAGVMKDAQNDAAAAAAAAEPKKGFLARMFG